MNKCEITLVFCTQHILGTSTTETALLGRMVITIYESTNAVMAVLSTSPLLISVNAVGRL